MDKVFDYRRQHLVLALSVATDKNNRNLPAALDIKFIFYLEVQYLCLLFPLEKAFRCCSRKISGVKTWADRAFPPIFHAAESLAEVFSGVWKNCEPGTSQGHELGVEAEIKFNMSMCLPCKKRRKKASYSSFNVISCN